MCATARVCGVCLSLYPPPLCLHAAPWVSVLVCREGNLPPATLTLAEGSYFDADDARQMGLLLPERERVRTALCD